MMSFPKSQQDGWLEAFRDESSFGKVSLCSIGYQAMSFRSPDGIWSALSWIIMIML